jgi:putative transcriptional regulator
MQETILKPLKGRILASVPFMNDYFFGRAVVLLTEHNDMGSAGLIINKPLDTKINSAIKNFPEFNAKLYLGGPVENNSLFFIHTAGNRIPDSLKVLPDLYWGGDFEVLKTLVSEKKISTEEIKFFVGYSGWAPDQLNQELKRNSWVVMKTSKKVVMDKNSKRLWEMNIRNSSREYAVWAKFPVNPSLN